MNEKSSSLVEAVPVLPAVNGKNGSNGHHARKPLSFLMNGRTVVCDPDLTILQAAQQNGIEIPRLC
jgi:hypothetical protein